MKNESAGTGGQAGERLGLETFDVDLHEDRHAMLADQRIERRHRDLDALVQLCPPSRARLPRLHEIARRGRDGRIVEVDLHHLARRGADRDRLDGDGDRARRSAAASSPARAAARRRPRARRAGGTPRCGRRHASRRRTRGRRAARSRHRAGPWRRDCAARRNRCASETPRSVRSASSTSGAAPPPRWRGARACSGAGGAFFLRQGAEAKPHQRTADRGPRADDGERDRQRRPARDEQRIRNGGQQHVKAEQENALQPSSVCGQSCRAASDHGTE